ncbi:MAG: hypothetical protein J6P50_06235, partial [Bacteroidales bacterium]|nr:hypothetical protein [Bacteroidales bacterium]
YKMMRQLYGQMSHGHYDQEYALADVAKMFYIDKVGAKHSAPYWNENQVREVYEQVKKEIPAGYNFWDFYVALQMTKSNTSELIEKWFPNATPEEREKKIVELAVNEFNDPDSPDNGHKIWAKLSKH